MSQLVASVPLGVSQHSVCSLSPLQTNICYIRPSKETLDPFFKLILLSFQSVYNIGQPLFKSIQPKNLPTIGKKGKPYSCRPRVQGSAHLFPMLHQIAINLGFKLYWTPHYCKQHRISCWRLTSSFRRNSFSNFASLVAFEWWGQYSWNIILKQFNLPSL